MFLLPKGNPIFESLAVSKLKLPDVLSKLSNGSLTGYASFIFSSHTAILVFESGNLISAIVEGKNGEKESGFSALSTLSELMVSTGSGALNVYKLSTDLAMCIHALVEGEMLYKAQELKLLNIKALLEKVKDDQMNGCLRVYTDDHSALIFYKNGNPLGFFHDGSSDIEISSTESQKIAGLPGAKMDLYATQSADELRKTNLLEVTNVQNLWEVCVVRHKAETDRLNLERQERDRKVVVQKCDELGEQVKALVEEYVGRVGRGIVEKVIADNGGNTCLLETERVDSVVRNIERSAKLLISGIKIRAMMEALTSLLSTARSEL
ncbi:MAG: GTPase-activating protein [Desulfuromonadaceae bacterium]|nr:GTPase-activating protein [Desulfuromonadaceae bacterium]MDD5107378.1 GTPase-activating protein [Desulfuromonadaceae bacterium]